MALSVPQSPNTILYLCKNAIIDPSYNHVYDFASEIQQRTYFTTPWPSGKAFYIFDGSAGRYGKLTYQRMTESIRVNIPRDMLEFNGINYLAFKNSRYDPVTVRTYEKMYYCFITEMNYVNENVTEINFAVDVYQTYMFDFILKPCYVEREMINVSEDEPGANIVTESIGYGEYVQHGLTSTGPGTSGWEEFKNDEWAVVIASTFDRDYQSLTGDTSVKGVYNYFGIASGLAYLIFTDFDALSTWLIRCTAENGSPGIQGAYVVPRILCGGTSPTDDDLEDYDDDIEPNGTHSQLLHNNIIMYDKPTALGNYTPVNKKLLTYPYNMLFLTNNNAASRVYKWEYFETPTMCTFGLFGCPIMPVEAAMVPVNYNGSGVNGYNMWERLVMTDFPMCSFDIDTFRAYLAANKFKIGSQIFSTIMETGAELFLGKVGRTTGKTIRTSKHTSTKGRVTTSTHEETSRRYGTNAVDLFESDFNSLASITGTLFDVKSKPPTAYGETTNILNMASSMGGFKAYQTCIRPEYAKIIDDYFSKFGYAVHEIKTPNLTNRLHWNYIKTLDSIIMPRGNALNMEEMTFLQGIFDSGVTIWHCLKNSNGNMSGEGDFGNYSNDNHQSA